MYKWLLCISALILLVACSEEPVIIQKDTKQVDPNQDPEFVEEQTEDEEVDQFIEFTLPDEEVKINLEMVPILNAYLQGIQNRQQALEKMNMFRVSATDKNLYLLEFSCQDELCSYLLLDQTEDNQAYLIADLAKYIQAKASPDNTRILLRFHRKLTSPAPYSNIAVIDLEEWRLIPLANEMNDKDVLNYKWPILTADWVDNDTITISHPDITEASPENIKQWQESKKTTVSVELTLNTND
ncbi:hypothetical protein [Virgibacillus litoralis]|uniref:Lipoprotein n=1 Tax=Virgibacillus litoralis TaxID=578221 RepID=A0ABS4HCR2_9BACI|nr:hypothetical protein [Virgibacillus litoralis]MBP1948705.1 hypothetical protein [Virgibacillus litoralis]